MKNDLNLMHFIILYCDTLKGLKNQGEKITGENNLFKLDAFYSISQCNNLSKSCNGKKENWTA